MDTLKILDQIELLVEEEKAKFLGFVRLDEDHFFQLTNKLRASLPDDLRKAGRVAENTDRIIEAAQSEASQTLIDARSESERMLAEARAEAERITVEAHNEAVRVRETAQAEAKQLVDNSEISRIASAQARSIRDQAEEDAREIRSGADDYAREVLLSLERHIEESLRQAEAQMTGLLGTVQRGRLALEKGLPKPRGTDNITVASAPFEPAPDESSSARQMHLRIGDKRTNERRSNGANVYANSTNGR